MALFHHAGLAMASYAQAWVDKSVVTGKQSKRHDLRIWQQFP
jgi:hypothetical protein